MRCGTNGEVKYLGEVDLLRACFGKLQDSKISFWGLTKPRSFQVFISRVRIRAHYYLFLSRHGGLARRLTRGLRLR